MKQVEINDFCKYKFLSAVEYSPNGSVAAFVVAYANEADNTYEGNIWVLENGKTRKLTGLNRERSFFFEDDENILFPATRTEKEKENAKNGIIETNYYRINIHGGEAEKVFTLPYDGNIVKRLDENRLLVCGTIDVNCPDYYCLSEKERREYVEKKKENADYEVFDEWPFHFNGQGVINKTRSAIYIYDTKKDTSLRISDPLFSVSDYFIRDNKVYFVAAPYKTIRPLGGNLYKYDPETGDTKELFSGSRFFLDSAFDYQGHTLLLGSYCRDHGLNENERFYDFNEKTGSIRLLNGTDSAKGCSAVSDCVLGGGKQIVVRENVYYLSTHRYSGAIVSFAKDGTETSLFEGNGTVNCFDVKNDESEILFIGQLPGKLQELYQLKNGKLKQLTHLNDSCIKGRYVSEPEHFLFKSRGFELDGFVLKPIDFDEKRKYPAILEIHGGPKCVFSDVFFHEMQYFASCGYFVFFCNPVGGDGRGDVFADIRGQYGGIDFDNLMAFTDTVLKNYPQIDSKRVGVTGGSYGGFMTNWIVGHTDRFACAATQRSISNWISFYGISDIGTYFSMDQTGGDIYKNVDKMWAESPLKYADKVKTPLLFIHSDEDYRCPLSQGLQFYTALINRGVETRMCMFHGENHELSRSGKPKHRIRRLTEIREWMDKHLKNAE